MSLSRPTLKECEEAVRKAFDFCEKECKRLSMVINPSKTQFAAINRKAEDVQKIELSGGEKIKHIKRIRHLGMWTTNNLDVKPHIDQIVLKLKEARGTILNLMATYSSRNLFEIAYSLGIGKINFGFDVMPILPDCEYNRIAKEFAKIIADILRVKNAKNIIGDDEANDSYVVLFRTAGYPGIKPLHIKSILCSFNNILMNKKPDNHYERILRMIQWSDGSRFNPDYDDENEWNRRRKGLFLTIKAFPLVSGIKNKGRFFPYNAHEVSKLVPGMYLRNLGCNNFYRDIKMWMKLECPHPAGKIGCAFCYDRKRHNAIIEEMILKLDNLERRKSKFENKLFESANVPLPKRNNKCLTKILQSFFAAENQGQFYGTLDCDKLPEPTKRILSEFIPSIKANSADMTTNEQVLSP